MTELGAFFNDILIWVVGGIATAGSAALGVIKGNYKRSTKNKRQLQGDDDDPNTDGVLEISKRNGEKIDNLEDKMEEHHGLVMGEVEELAREIRNDGD